MGMSSYASAYVEFLNWHTWGLTAAGMQTSLRRGKRIILLPGHMMRVHYTVQVVWILFSHIIFGRLWQWACRTIYIRDSRWLPRTARRKVLSRHPCGFNLPA